ncbi:MAG: 4Fe-4S binding protein [Oscillospiraceae bacterium]|nr:4Fe-4S binding protein [Oscillospiraceae bacterium]
MAFFITDECLSCGSCAAQCPAEAIDMGELHYQIDPEKCLDCGSCAAQCPAEAIIEK